MSHMAITGVALVTGAASGIGRETAFTFAEAGAKAVVFADKQEEKAKEAAEQSKAIAAHSEYQALAVHVDVRDISSVQAMVDRTVKRFGRIDYSVNSAGLGSQSRNPIAKISVEEFDLLSSVNSRGVLLCNQAVLKVMLEQEPVTVEGRSGSRNIGKGSIVNVASASSFAIGAGYAPYTTSKHAVIGVTKTAALENGPLGVRVNAICPSWTDTPIMDLPVNKSPEFKALIKNVVPLGRIAQPEEVGGIIVFMCSPAASYVNGTAMVVDGGLTLTVHGRA